MKTIELNEQQIALLKKAEQLTNFVDVLSYYLEDYYKNQQHMSRKKRDNIEFLAKHSIPYAKQIDSLLNDIRKQLKE